MQSIFSHAEPAPDDVPTPGARSFEVSVPVDAAIAFEGFVDSIHLWWPVSDYSKFGDNAHAVFAHGALYEESESGEEYLWGEVRRSEPPRFLEISWQLGDNPLTPPRVIVEFAGAPDGGTAVKLTHDGWAPGDAGHAQWEKFCDWPLILARYARFMGVPADLD